MKKFSQDEFNKVQLDIIAKLHPDRSGPFAGRSGRLFWQIGAEQELSVFYMYEPGGDDDGAVSWIRNIGFDELINIIKSPSSHFDTGN